MASQTPRPRLDEKSGKHAAVTNDAQSARESTAEKTVMFIGQTADEWKEVAADRILQGADWLATATSRLSDRLSHVAHDDGMRENAVKAVSVVTGASAFLAGSGGWIRPVSAYRATAEFARERPKTAAIGGLVTAAALYGAYRAFKVPRPTEPSRSGNFGY